MPRWENPDWSADEIEVLKLGWLELGKSAEQCSRLLKRRLGVTRSRAAICGFVDRNRDVFGSRVPASKVEAA